MNFCCGAACLLPVLEVCAEFFWLVDQRVLNATTCKEHLEPIKHGYCLLMALCTTPHAVPMSLLCLKYPCYNNYLTPLPCQFRPLQLTLLSAL